MTRSARRPPSPQPPMPEGAANPATATPSPVPTSPTEFHLYDGHLNAECSLLGNGAPACPACLERSLRERIG